MSNQISNDRIKFFETTQEASLIDILVSSYGLDEVRALELMNLGAIYCNQTRVAEVTDARGPVLPVGTLIRAHLQARRYGTTHVDWAHTIHFENESFVVVDKPNGIPVHPTVDNAVENVLMQLKRYFGYPLYITQRLDIGTRGLFLIAKTQKFQSYFNSHLRNGTLDKSYRALTLIAPTLGSKVHFMEPSLRAPRTVVDTDQAGFARCELIVESTEPLGIYTQSQIRLLTGRTHQIRTQFGKLGHPIIDDLMYGGTPVVREKRPEYDTFALACDAFKFHNHLENRNYEFALNRVVFPEYGG